MKAFIKLPYEACFGILLLLSFNGGIAIYGRQVNIHADPTSLPPAYEITSDTAAFVTLPTSVWQIMPDPGGNLVLTDVLQSDRFQQNDRSVNYQNHVYWLRYQLVNKMSHEIRIALPENATYADLYSKSDSSENWQHFRTGTLVHWSNRDGLKRIPAFTLTIPTRATTTVYKRIYWNYVATQPDTIAVIIASTGKLIQENYVNNDSAFLTSLQNAFILGLFVLSMLISFYFFLVVREKEFLYFTLYLLMATL